jgi:hypothetical protein
MHIGCTPKAKLARKLIENLLVRQPLLKLRVDRPMNLLSGKLIQIFFSLKKHTKQLHAPTPHELKYPAIICQLLCSPYSNIAMFGNPFFKKPVNCSSITLAIS